MTSQSTTVPVVSRLTSDVQVVQDVLSSTFSMFARSVLLIIAILIVLLVLSPILTAVLFGGLLLLFGATSVYQQLIRKVQRVIQEAKAKMSNVAEESFTNIRTVKAFSNEQAEVDKFLEGNTVVYLAGTKKAFWSAFFALLNQGLLFGSMGAICYTAAHLYQDGNISVGDVSAFLFYMQLLVMSFWIISMTIGNLASVLSASEKIYEIMKFPIKINNKGGDTIDGEVTGSLELRDVKFRYPSKADVQVLKGVSLSVDNDNKRVVALCGTSGCGKSSIISLIERFYDPEEGGVFFNGRNIKELDQKWYHNQIAIV